VESCVDPSYGRESVEPLFFESPLARAMLSLSLGMPANPSTGTRGQQQQEEGRGRFRITTSAITLTFGRPPLASPSSPPSKQTNPSHHHHPSNRFIIIVNATPAIKANLEPPTREPLVIEHDQLTRNPKVDLETTTKSLPTSQQLVHLIL
jgi:hypothetical protein